MDKNTEYTSADHIGKTGIEKEYEDELKGSKVNNLFFCIIYSLPYLKI